jgi:hypothetical protein
MQALHQKMAEALRATGRPIEYKVHDSINIFPGDDVKSWGRKVGANLWRTGDDLVDGERWKSVSDRFERHGKIIPAHGRLGFQSTAPAPPRTRDEVASRVALDPCDQKI